MCGISGKINFEGKEIPEELIRRMSAELSHRGPDDEGIYVHNGSPGTRQQSVSVGLGHKRLSIIDLSNAGHQPMANESRTVWIVSNGEVYGYKELQKKLEQKGHRFSSHSDCEAIIHLYEQEGIECLQKLNGMFAFALWDSRIQTLYLVRDRLGIKPLVYFSDGTSLIFASEIKSILRDSEVPKEMDWDALNLYLTARNKSVEIRQYWDIDKDSKNEENEGCDIETCKKGLHDLLEEAVRMQLMADVPVGAFLSGGIDSSIIVGLMSRVSAQPVHTYSIGYKDMPLFDETRYAREVARFHHTNHHEILVTGQDILKIIPDVLTSFDEPFADSSAIPTYVVSRETKRHVKVALSGDGCDELFAGYKLYTGEYWYSRYSLFPRVLRKKIIEPFLLTLPDSRDKYSLEYLRRIKKFILGAEDSFEDRFYAWN
jgi:asparagine synthase (glutamine-hydrolysing)